MAVDMVRSFKKYKFRHSAAAVIYAPAIFGYLGLNNEEKYDGPTLPKERAYKQQIEEARKNNNPRQLKKLIANNPYHKSGSREWVEAIVFAVFAAAFIRMFLIEAYKIPTPSMEGSLMVGDFLFVSKAHYGIRMPMTPIMVPLLHNRIPFLNTESYLKNPKLSYKRLPAIENIDRNEPIVFNWPAGDSVYLSPSRSWTHGQVSRNPIIASQVRNAELIVRPIDKKDHYIKRCIAIPGDSLEIRNREVFINGSPAPKPSGLQYEYLVRSESGTFNKNRLEAFGVNIHEPGVAQNRYHLTEAQVEKIKAMASDIIVSVIPHSAASNELFPHDKDNFKNWSNDNYGPIWIPSKGSTVDININNSSLYKRVIGVYESNDLEVIGEQILINGNPATSYTFKQDYFWAMGDNRHNSEDSRFWGFVPEDHIVGKPLFIWFSTKYGNMANGINWNRIFTSANKM
jgi:signal peptidase I